MQPNRPTQPTGLLDPVSIDPIAEADRFRPHSLDWAGQGSQKSRKLQSDQHTNAHIRWSLVVGFGVAALIILSTLYLSQRRTLAPPASLEDIEAANAESYQDILRTSAVPDQQAISALEPPAPIPAVGSVESEMRASMSRARGFSDNLLINGFQLSLPTVDEQASVQQLRVSIQGLLAQAELDREQGLQMLAEFLRLMELPVTETRALAELQSGVFMRLLQLSRQARVANMIELSDYYYDQALQVRSAEPNYY